MKAMTTLNKVFIDSPLTFDKKAEDLGVGVPIDVGVQISPSYDANFCVFAPKAERVEIIAMTSQKVKRSIDLKKCNDAAFRGVLPFQDTFTGLVNVLVYTDGNLVLDPYLPIIWTANRPFNCVEIPDPDNDYFFIKNVPHGAYIRQLYWAESMGDWERCMIYTPPGYMNGTESYPVLYLLNGGTDNETSWEYAGRASNITDNLIAEGRAEPFIIVMNNGMLRQGGKVSLMRDLGFERMLIDSCIPFIEQNYRVKIGKWNRAIAGLSMGAYMTCDISMGNPDLFGYVGHFTASMTHHEIQTSYNRPYTHFLKTVTPQQFDKLFKVYFRSTTPQEDHLDYFEADDALLAEAKFDQAECYYRILYPERTTKWNSWRLGYRDFATLLFKSSF